MIVLTSILFSKHVDSWSWYPVYREVAAWKSSLNSNLNLESNLKQDSRWFPRLDVHQPLVTINCKAPNFPLGHASPDQTEGFGGVLYLSFPCFNFWPWAGEGSFWGMIDMWVNWILFISFLLCFASGCYCQYIQYMQYMQYGLFWRRGLTGDSFPCACEGPQWLRYLKQDRVCQKGYCIQKEGELGAVLLTHSIPLMSILQPAAPW